MNRILKILMISTDIGFILYWTITALHIIPDALLFKDYTQPIMVSWNWSFLPLDLIVSATGLSGMVLASSKIDGRKVRGQLLMTISLVLTMVAGLQALSFWAIRADFDAVWWAANGFLLLWPIVFLIPRLKGAN